MLYNAVQFLAKHNKKLLDNLFGLGLQTYIFAKGFVKNLPPLSNLKRVDVNASVCKILNVV